MRALTSAWAEDGGTVIGLAPSAAAAAVLRESTGADTDTLAKLVHSLHTGDLPDWADQIGPRTLVVVDEAGMADTLSLDTTVAFVLNRGGQVRRLVPVIGRLVEDQLRSAARQVTHEAVRCLEQRCPVQEVRVGLERRAVVVEKVQARAAGMHRDAVQAGQLQGTIGPALDFGDVGWKRQVEVFGHGPGLLR